MKKRTKYIFLIGIGMFACFCILLLFGSLFYLETGHAQKIIQNKINASIPGKINWGAFKLSLIKGALEIDKVSIRESSGNQVISIDRLFLNIDWLPLLNREISIADLRAEKPVVNMALQKDGALNLLTVFSDTPSQPSTEVPVPEKKKGYPLPFNVVLHALKLINGEVSFTESQATDIKISSLNIAADGNLSDQKGTLSIKFSGGHVKLKDFQTQLNQFYLSGSYDKGQLFLSDLKAAIPGTTVMANGNANNIIDDLSLDIELSIKTELSELNKLFSLEQPFSGSAAADLTVTGPLNNPNATLLLNYDGGMVYDYTVNSVKMDIALNDQVATLNHLMVLAAAGKSKLSGMVDLQKAFPKGFLNQSENINLIAYEFKLNQNKLKIDQLLKTDNAVSGDVTTAIEISGHGISPQYITAQTVFSLSADNLISGKFKEANQIILNGSAGLDNNTVTLKQLTALSKGVKLQASGQMDITEKTLDGKLTATAKDIHPLLSAFGIDNSQGNVSLKTQISGPLKHPVADFSLFANQLSSGNITIGDLKISADINTDGVLNVSSLNLNNQEAKINGLGTIQLLKATASQKTENRKPFVADFQNIQPRFFIQNPDFSGIVNGQLTIYDLADTPDLAIKVSGKDILMGDFSMGDILSDIRLSQGVLTSTQTELRNKKSAINIKGESRIFEGATYQTVKTPSIKVAIQSDGMQLEDFIPDMKGAFTLDARMQGTIENLNGNLNLQGNRINVYSQPIQSLSLNAEIQGDKMTIHPLDIFLSPGEAIHLNGWVSKNKTYDLWLAADGISLSNIQPGKFTDAITGTLSGDFKGRGSFDDPQLTGNLELTKTKMEGKALSDVRIDVKVENQLAEVSGALNFKVNAVYHLMDKTFSLNTHFENSDLKPYFGFFDKPDFSGNITGNIDFSGTAGNSKSYIGKLDLTHIGIQYENQPIIDAKNVRVSFKDQEAQINNFYLSLPDEGNLTVNGTIQLDNAISVHSQGSIPLSLLRFVSEDLSEISGNLKIGADITGPLSGPSISGRIEAENVETLVPVLSQRLHNTSAIIQITPQAITIESLKGHLDTGRFEMTGRLDLDHLKPAALNAELKANQLPINVPDTLDLTLNTNLKIHGNPEKSIIEGDMVLIDGLYYKDVKLNPLASIGQKKRQTAPASSKTPQPFLNNMELNISIKNKNPFVVDNNISHMEILPDLRVKGTAANPIINGRTSVKSGQVEFRKRIFVIKKGVIDFLNPYKTEPTIDIKGESQIRDWLVGLDISGTPDQLAFKLSSDPPLEDGDILSLLVLGKTSGEMIEGEGGSNQSAAQMLSQVMASRLNEDIKKNTGLDIFEAEVQSQNGNGNGSEVKVTLGKELTKRMTLKYSAQTENGEVVQQTIAEYKAIGNILLNVFQGNQGNYGGTVKYRLEFR